MIDIKHLEMNDISEGNISYAVYMPLNQTNLKFAEKRISKEGTILFCPPTSTSALKGDCMRLMFKSFTDTEAVSSLNNVPFFTVLY